MCAKKNILVSDTGDCLLCDFGLSRIRHELSRTSTIVHQGGLYRFIAPEIPFEGEERRINEQSDIYSLTMTIYALGTRSPPFEDMGPSRARRAAKEGKRPSKPDSLGGLAIEHANFLWSIMETMWNQDPQLRPTISAVRAKIARSDLVNLVQKPTPTSSKGAQHLPITPPPCATDESINQDPTVDEWLGDAALFRHVFYSVFGRPEPNIQLY
jgi:serine/threonine protein kinase